MGVARYCKFVDLAPIRQSIQALLIVLTRENRDHEFQKPLSAVGDLHFESVGLLSRLVDSCRVFWLVTPPHGNGKRRSPRTVETSNVRFKHD